EELLDQGFDTAEALDALDRIVGSGIGPVVVASTADPRGWQARLNRAYAPIGDSTPGEQVAIGNDAGDFNEIELAIAGMWQELLGAQMLSRLDNFFALGGHSLAAVRLLSRIERRFRRGLGGTDPL